MQSDVLSLLSLFLAASLGAVPAPPGGTAVPDGIAVELRVEPQVPGQPLQEGNPASFRFKISDAATGNPVAGSYPAAWMEALQEGEDAGEGCVRRVKEFLGGNLFNRPALDLNVYHVLALNQDATISVVDPLFGFGGTKLLAMIKLSSPGEDWVLDASRTRLFVSLPDTGRVAVVDTLSWKVISEIEVGERPRRLALQPDGAYLWVTFEAGVAALSTRDLKIAARIPTGRGEHDLAVTDDSRFAFVSNRDAGTLSVLDVAKLAKVRDVAVGSAPTALAFSPLARAVYVASETAGTIVAVDSARHEVVARIQKEPGLGAIRFAPGGRLGFIPDPAGNRVHLLDVSVNRIVQTAAIDAGPDQITFSDNLAYVRRRASEVVLMIPLDEVGEAGRPVPVVDFPGGQNPLGKVSRSSPADSIVRAPGATAVLVANPADKVIYYYKEGMAAPMGSFTNYSREPRALLVVDRSLREKAPGAYETVAQVARPGRYRMAFYLDAPRTVRCFEVAVAASPELEARRARERPIVVEPVETPPEVAAGQPVRLRFRLTDPATRAPVAGLEDVNVMTYRSPGNWQERRWARQVGDGIYEIEVVPPEPGNYRVAVECRSRNLLFHRSPQIRLEAR